MIASTSSGKCPKPTLQMDSKNLLQELSFLYPVSDNSHMTQIQFINFNSHSESQARNMFCSKRERERERERVQLTQKPKPHVLNWFITNLGICINQGIWYYYSFCEWYYDLKNKGVQNSEYNKLLRRSMPYKKDCVNFSNSTMCLGPQNTHTHTHN